MGARQVQRSHKGYKAGTKAATRGTRRYEAATRGCKAGMRQLQGVQMMQLQWVRQVPKPRCEVGKRQLQGVRQVAKLKPSPNGNFILQSDWLAPITPLQMLNYNQ